MGNAATAHDNKADDTDTVTISASGSLAQAPASLLIDPVVGNKWAVNADTAYILSSGSIASDTLMLAGLTGTSPTFRVRYSSVDVSGEAGDLHDSGSFVGTPYFDPDYGLFVYLLPAPITSLVRRIDITEAGVSRIAAGRVFDGVRQAFDINFAPGWSRTPVRGSTDTFGEGGHLYPDLRQGHWRVAAQFGFVSETAANGFLEDMAVAVVENGHQDMLWIRDPESTNLSRDSIWGWHDGDWPRTQEHNTVPPLFSVPFNIRQRR